jgi:phospholipid/cholesterol/gamma-HCH transport system substrate-binding protein
VINNAPPLSGPHIISNIPAQGSTVEGMLLPDTAAPPPPDPNAPLLPAEGTPPS